ncbi:MAG: 3'(2'),5'-bisphosphate nucleotidase CysQ [Aestuariivirga sp.]
MESSVSELDLEIVRLAHTAGQVIMEIYAAPIEVATKSDHSPVTQADQQAEDVILAGLKKLCPEIPVLAEESVSKGNIPEIGARFFLVDPLDGTKEFISRNGEFTVNIALIENNVPIFGVIYAPALGDIYFGRLGQGAMHARLKTTEAWAGLGNTTAIRTRPMPVEGATVLASRSHCDAETEAFIAKSKVAKLISAGSSLKFCKVAAGEADLYPRFGRTMEWDTAAGHAILLAAGGKVLTIDGKPLGYGKKIRGFDNPAFIASA